jgi:hypothetical protein
MVFYTLEDVHEYIDSGEANKTPKHIENLYRRGAMAKGGSVKYVDTKYSQDSGGVPHFLRFPNAIGSFAWRFGKYNEGILYNLDDFDKDYYSHLRLKNGEKLFRYSTDKMIDGSKYLIKINLDKGLIYFMSEQNDINDDKNISFETRGIKSEYILLDKDKFADGGGVNEEEISANRYLEVEELNRKINYLTQQIESDYRNNEIDNYTIRNEKELDRFKQKLEFLMYGRDAYADGGSVDDFSEYNFQVGDKLDLGSKGIKYFKQYDGEKIIVVDSKSDLKSSKGSYTYPSSVKKVLNKRYSTGGGVGKMELRKVYDGRYENSSKEEVLVIDAGINDAEFTRFAIYDEILDFNVGDTKTKQEAISKL